MTGLSRRGYLGAAVAVGTAATAGCVSPPGRSGAPLPDYSGWLPAGLLVELDRASAQHVDVATLRDWPEADRAVYDPGPALGTLGLEPATVDGFTLVGEPGSETAVFEGSFEAATVREALEVDAEPGETDGRYAIHETIAGPLALRAGVAVLGRRYRELLAVNRGETEPIARTDETWNRALRRVRDAPIATVGPAGGTGDDPLRTEQPVLLEARGITRGDGSFTYHGYLFFEGEAAAETALETVRSNLEAAGEARGFEEWRADRTGAELTVEIVGDRTTF